MKKIIFFLGVTSSIFSGWALNIQAQEKPARTITRLFWQDGDTHKVMWGDVKRNDAGWSLETKELSGFPKLDTERQSLVQMVANDGVIIVGIRDEEQGKFGSGWVAIDAGVTVEDHGDHSHWYYNNQPKVLHSQLDADQGNPAHVYLYDGQVVLANDSKNGLTILDVNQLKQGQANKSARFFSGGGNHITIAVHDKKVAYSTWVDREGDNAGRIDVLSVASDASSKPKGYSFKLPSSGLHGATAAGNRVFFAPADGVYSVRADTNLNQPPKPEEVDHISLGTDAKTNRPNRTGAFSVLDNWVLFSYGSGENAKIGLINANEAKPRLREISLPAGEGLSLVTPTSVKGPKNKSLAFVAHDRKQSESKEKLSILDLDPNGDSDFADAKVVASLDVGPSKVEGHAGHHDISFTPNKRFASVCNAGDGTISVISLSDLTVQTHLKVGGTPSRVLAQ